MSSRKWNVLKRIYLQKLKLNRQVPRRASLFDTAISSPCRGLHILDVYVDIDQAQRPTHTCSVYALYHIPGPRSRSMTFPRQCQLTGGPNFDTMSRSRSVQRNSFPRFRELENEVNIGAQTPISFLGGKLDRQRSTSSECREWGGHPWPTSDSPSSFTGCHPIGHGEDTFLDTAVNNVSGFCTGKLLLTPYGVWQMHL